MKRYILLPLIFFAFSTRLYTQYDCQKDIILLKHLINSKKPHEALVLSHYLINNSWCNNLNDSLYFFRAYSFYQLKQLDSATFYFLKIQQPDTLYNKSRIYASISSLYEDKIKLTDSIISTLKITSNIMSDLQKLFRAGLSLYNNQPEKYSEWIKQLNYDNYMIANEITGLDEVYKKIIGTKRKSPAKAAILSAIIPGSGKWYAGRRGQAITSFLTVGILAAITTELIAKRGVNDFFSISALTTTAIFYVGNIYGSYYTTKYENTRFNEKIHQDIQYYLHVAVRNVYY